MLWSFRNVFEELDNQKSSYLFFIYIYLRLLLAPYISQSEKHLYHSFTVMINELKLAETVPHKTAVMVMINALISGCPDRPARMRVRADFVGEIK